MLLTNHWLTIRTVNYRAALVAAVTLAAVRTTGARRIVDM
jgi:hypothetical protein